MDAIRIQKTIRDNATEVSNFVSELEEWEQEATASAKEEHVPSSVQTTSRPVRNANVVHLSAQKDPLPSANPDLNALKTSAKVESDDSDSDSGVEEIITPGARRSAAADAERSEAPKSASGTAADHTYDRGYNKWEKFNVDKALEEVDHHPPQPKASAKAPSNSKPKQQATPKENKASTTNTAAEKEYTGDIPVPSASEESTDTGKKKKKAKVKRSREERCMIHKMKGNDFFKQERYLDAIAEYTRSIDVMPELAVPYANRAMAYLKSGNYRAAEEDCTKCLERDPTFVKAFARRASARKYLSRPKEALKDYQAALALSPHNAQVKLEVTRLKKELKPKVKPKPKSNKRKAATKPNATSSAASNGGGKPTRPSPSDGIRRRRLMIEEVSDTDSDEGFSIAKSLDESSSSSSSHQAEAQTSSSSSSSARSPTLTARTATRTASSTLATAQSEAPSVSSSMSPMSATGPSSDNNTVLRTVSTSTANADAGTGLPRASATSTNADADASTSLPRASATSTDAAASTTAAPMSVSSDSESVHSATDMDSARSSFSSHVSLHDATLARDFKTPKIFAEFSRAWSSLRRNPLHRAAYVKVLNPKSFKKFFEGGIESTVFEQLICSIRDAFVPDATPIALEFLSELTKCDRFDLAVMFMDGNSKRALLEILAAAAKEGLTMASTSSSRLLQAYDVQL